MVTDDRNDSYEVFKCASLEQFELEFKLSHQIVCAFSLREIIETLTEEARNIKLMKTQPLNVVEQKIECGENNQLLIL